MPGKQKEIKLDVFLQPLNDKLFVNKGLNVDVLRLDKVHPIVSGNKIFKLKYYLEEAKNKGYKGLLTFGGSWSNHLVATAFATKVNGLHSIGIVRGEEPRVLSPTLKDCREYGMTLKFVSREEYKKLNDEGMREPEYLTVKMGGYGAAGARGAEEILDTLQGLNDYTDIACAVGTGTMLAGLVNKAGKQKRVVGISSMKNNFGLEKEVNLLLLDTTTPFKIIHDYHFGGFGKYNDNLLEFMSSLEVQHDLPTDLVYTSKLLYGIYDMVGTGYFRQGSKILVIHSGGLQGNRSINPNNLNS